MTPNESPSTSPETSNLRIDRQHPLAFNPLDCSDVEQRPLVASGILSAFKKIYGDSWGPRMEHIFRNALLALLDKDSAVRKRQIEALNGLDSRMMLPSGTPSKRAAEIILSLIKR